LSAPHSALKRPPQPRKLLITEIRSLEEKTIEGAETLFGFRWHILGPAAQAPVSYFENSALTARVGIAREFLFRPGPKGPRELKAAGQRGSSRSVVGRTSERTIACA
jgi:hypothetical protein